MSLSTGPTPQPSLPLRAGDLLLILIVSLGVVRLAGGFLAVQIAGGLGEGASGQDLLAATLVLLLVQALVIVGMIRLFVLRKYNLSWADIGLRPVERRWYGRAVAVAVLLMPAVALINALIPKFAGEPFENPQIYAIAPAGFSWVGLLGMMVMAGAVAPFAEELAFRGLLFGWLRERLRLATAIGLSGLAFAVLHGVLLLIPALTLIGIVLAVLYQRSGSLWPPIIAHGVFNAVMVVALYSALAGGVEMP